MKRLIPQLLYTFFSILLLSSIGCKNPKSNNTAQLNDSTENKWWKEAIVYQLYPRSFKDSDGDGIGDLKGIISKLDYIKSLGVTAVWLNPIYSSPNDDNGYDISDYRNIMKEFGSMEDFDNLLKGMHERGIKLVMDLVVNHSSDEHDWFKQSRSSRTNPYRNYYHWWNADRGKPNYRYSLFDVNHDAWKYDSVSDAYYLHYFSQKQPDLNWENPKLRNEVFDIMKFWLDKGIDGFRIDAFQYASKDTTYPAFPKGFEKDFVQYYAMGKNLHSYLKEMNEQVLSKYDVLSVAEGAGRNYQDGHDLVDADRKELSMAYGFDWIGIPDEPNGFQLKRFKEVTSKLDSVYAIKGWQSIFLANHDNARMVSRFGNDSPEFREVSSKMLSTYVLTMRGTPYYYYGDEIGMNNIRMEKIEDYNDVASLNEYRHLKETGGDLKKFIEKLKNTCRDNGRTPFQWDTSSSAGFTIGKPWLKVNPNFKLINVLLQESDKNSCLNYFRKLTKLRNENKLFVYGKFMMVDKDNNSVYAYTREYQGKKVLVVLNFTNKTASYTPGLDLSKASIMLDNYDSPSLAGTLKPYEAAIYQLN
jgi:oligo-1,6-glucosidase